MISSTYTEIHFCKHHGVFHPKTDEFWNHPVSKGKVYLFCKQTQKDRQNAKKLNLKNDEDRKILINKRKNNDDIHYCVYHDVFHPKTKEFWKFGKKPNGKITLDRCRSFDSDKKKEMLLASKQGADKELLINKRKNDDKQHFCKRHNTHHPKTKEFFTFRKIDGEIRIDECREFVRERIKQFCNKNKDRLNSEKRSRNKDPEVRLKKKLYHKKSETKARAKKRFNERMASDFNFYLKNKIRASIYKAVSRYTGKKKRTTIELLGCTVPFFKEYIASQFKNGMSWNNYGNMTWHLDHIIPSSAFDFANLEHQKLCFHYTNHQPMERINNIQKGGINREPSPGFYAKLIEEKKLVFRVLDWL